MVEAGAWGPIVLGGHGRRWPARVALASVLVVTTFVAALASVVGETVDAVVDNIEKIPITGLATAEDGAPFHVLIVGSDARGGLSPTEIDQLSLGEFEGQRSDTVILVTVSADRSSVSLVSMPRDLVVSDSDGGIAKLTETYGDGRDELVRVVTEDLGFPVNNYVEVSISGFIETVEAVGGVRICLDEPLFDRKSGAAFEAGCQEMTPAESLAFVRSRQGGLGDFARIDRQQQFLRALLARIVDLRLLLDPPRLVAVAEEVSANVTTDDQLSINRMVNLATDLQDVVGGDIEMVTVPGYTQRLNDAGLRKSFVVPYLPGLRALVDDVRNGRPLASRGTFDQRGDTRVAVWTGGRSGASLVESTLIFGGFGVEALGAGPVDVGGTTTVLAVPGFEEQAQWVAAMLGAPVAELPADADVPERVEVVVAVGDDASPSSSAG